MDVYETIITRRSTRKYRPDPVESEKLEKIVEAARYAPSGSNSQTNHLFIIQDPEVLSRLEGMVQDAFAKMEDREDMYISMRNSVRLSKKGTYAFFYKAPVLIVVANQKDYGNNMADTAVALENMMIEANALDLGSCYINQMKWLNEDPDLLAYMRSLGLEEQERVYGAVGIGYPDTENGLPDRKPLSRKGNVVTYV